MGWTERWQESLEMFKRWKGLFRLSGQRYFPAHTLLRRGMHQEAISAQKGYVKTHPDNPYGIAFLAALHHDHGDLDEAATMIQKALDIDAHQAGFHKIHGMIQRKSGHFETAITSFEETLRLDPRNSYSHRVISKCYKDLNELEKAESALLNALRAQPNDVEILNDLGCLKFDAEKLAEAERYFRSALQKSPRSGLVSLNLGKVYRAKEEFAKAKDAFDRAIAYGNTIVRAQSFRELGHLYSDQNDFAQAFKIYQKLLALDPEVAAELYKEIDLSSKGY